MDILTSYLETNCHVIGITNIVFSFMHKHEHGHNEMCFIAKIEAL